MGNCVASRSPRVQQNSNSNGKELISNEKVLPEKDALTDALTASSSAPAIRSHELSLHSNAEPSDGSFALFYPELEVTKQKLPNNGTIDPTEAPKVPLVRVVLGQAAASSSTVRECNTDGSIVAPKTMRKPSTSNSTSVLPDDNDASFSIIRSNSDLLQIAEPSDASFALLYPELEFTKQELPNSNGTINPATASLDSALPEKDASRMVKSNSDDLQIAEPSDGSFALLYPELEFTKQELPNSNGTIDPAAINTSSAAAQKEEKEAPAGSNVCPGGMMNSSSKVCLLQNTGISKKYLNVR
ncbi:MAG: hypothetical protein SGBAC_009644 [Bacillariaceae sp.]